MGKKNLNYELLIKIKTNPYDYFITVRIFNLYKFSLPNMTDKAYVNL